MESVWLAWWWAWHQIFALLKTHHLPLGNGSELNNKLHHKSTSRMGVLTHLCQFSPLGKSVLKIIITRQHISDRTSSLGEILQFTYPCCCCCWPRPAVRLSAQCYARKIHVRIDSAEWKIIDITASASFVWSVYYWVCYSFSYWEHDIDNIIMLLSLQQIFNLQFYFWKLNNFNPKVMAFYNVLLWMWVF